MLGKPLYLQQLQHHVHALLTRLQIQFNSAESDAITEQLYMINAKIAICDNLYHLPQIFVQAVAQVPGVAGCRMHLDSCPGLPSLSAQAGNGTSLQRQLPVEVAGHNFGVVYLWLDPGLLYNDPELVLVFESMTRQVAWTALRLNTDPGKSCQPG